MVTSAAENGAGGASPATSDPPKNEDGHVLKSRRGLLAAGLAVAVVGAFGVASTLNAGANQIPGDQDASQPPVVAAAADATDDASAPPVNLPWGSHPARAHRGRVGQSSASLADQGLQAAGADGARRDFAPKGKSMRSSFLKSEQTDFAPPEPAPSASATSDPATTAATTSPAAPSSTAAVAPSPTSSAGAAQPTPTDTPTILPTTPAASDPGTGDDDVDFLYSVGSQATTADGIYAAMDIKRPVLAKGDYHTLAELSVQSADSQQIIEVGWSVDRAVNGDSDPHIFVFHWVNGQPTCYNACGFVNYDQGINPGDTLPVDALKKFGIQYYNGAWWVAYDTTWVGYYPDSEWTKQGVTFQKGGFFQAFGEVAAASPKPCTQMGSGAAVDDSAAARIGSITYVNGPATPTLYTRTTTDVYGMNALSAKTFRYGGPGAC